MIINIATYDYEDHFYVMLLTMMWILLMNVIAS